MDNKYTGMKISKQDELALQDNYILQQFQDFFTREIQTSNEFERNGQDYEHVPDADANLMGKQFPINVQPGNIPQKLISGEGASLNSALGQDFFNLSNGMVNAPTNWLPASISPQSSMRSSSPPSSNYHSLSSPFSEQSFGSSSNHQGPLFSASSFETTPLRSTTARAPFSVGAPLMQTPQQSSSSFRTSFTDSLASGSSFFDSPLAMPLFDTPPVNPTIDGMAAMSLKSYAQPAQKSVATQTDDVVVLSRNEALTSSIFKSAARDTMHKYQKNKKHCVFCLKNKDSERVYSSHNIRDDDGNVTCPVLRNFVCPKCGATGNAAHTVSYCPNNFQL